MHQKKSNNEIISNIQNNQTFFLASGYCKYMFKKDLLYIPNELVLIIYSFINQIKVAYRPILDSNILLDCEYFLRIYTLFFDIKYSDNIQNDFKNNNIFYAKKAISDNQRIFKLIFYEACKLREINLNAKTFLTNQKYHVIRLLPSDNKKNIKLKLQNAEQKYYKNITLN